MPSNCIYNIGLNAFGGKVMESRTKLNNSKLGSIQHMLTLTCCQPARIISSQKIYGLYVLKHHILEEMRGGVTDAGQPTNRTLKIELLSQWKLGAEFCNLDFFLFVFV